LQNIKDGNPVAIYKSGSNWGSFIGITVNNLYVGMTCYIMGIFGGIGTFYFSLQNAIMLGAFQYFFLNKVFFGKALEAFGFMAQWKFLEL